MYGAVLRLKTELTGDVGGEADIGVLFLTNEGYSTMVSERRYSCVPYLYRCLVSAHASL